MKVEALVVDVVNSCVKWAAWDGAGQYPVLAPSQGKAARMLAPLVPLRDLGDVPTTSGPEAKRLMLTALRPVLADNPGVPVALVSVIPEITQWLAAEIPDLRIVDHAMGMPFRLSLAEPNRVGPDRLCNIAAAASAGFRNALVVDAGTATTFDLLLDGEFVGGMIAPGMGFALHQLGERAPGLDPVPFAEVGWDVGRNTGEALAAGGWHAGVGGVRSIVQGLQKRYGTVPVVFTGGLGGYLAEDSMPYDPHWTLRGTAILCQL